MIMLEEVPQSSSFDSGSEPNMEWEVSSVIADAADRVRSAVISSSANKKELHGKFESEESGHLIFIEIVTLEGDFFLVRASTQGYTIVRSRKDGEKEYDDEQTDFESLHALLTHVSVQYRSEFAGSLASALSKLVSPDSDV